MTALVASRRQSRRLARYSAAAIYAPSTHACLEHVDAPRALYSTLEHVDGTPSEYRSSSDVGHTTTSTRYPCLSKSVSLQVRALCGDSAA